ncbi:MAG: tetratricopeptide repeat protein [Pirellulaceae bacterium]|nr:tetratricopeptide repeat protein [Pirellulaceae bacterium]
MLRQPAWSCLLIVGLVIALGQRCTPLAAQETPGTDAATTAEAPPSDGQSRGDQSTTTDSAAAETPAGSDHSESSGEQIPPPVPPTNPTSPDPIVARIDMTLRLKDEIIDTIHKGDLLTVVAERANDYVIATLSGRKGAVAKDNAARLSESIPIYDELILQSPEEGRLYTLRASAHWAQGDPESALADFDKAIQLGYTESHAYASRGLFHSTMGQHDKAIEDFTLAIAKDPKDQVPRMNRASVYMVVGKYDLAVADYSAALETHSQNPVLFSQRAVAHKLLGKLELAVKDYDSAIDLVSNDISAWMGRGFIKFQMGQHQAAIDDFTKVIELAPQSAVAFNNRGYNYQMLGNFARATADYQRAVELAPRFVLALVNRAWLLATCTESQLRDPVIAIELAKVVNDISQYKDVNDLTLLAACFASADDFETAIGWQEKVIQLANADQLPVAQKILELYQDKKPIDPQLLIPPQAAGQEPTQPTERQPESE